MKRLERDKARTLRQKGMSMNDIAKTLSVSKASVSSWVRNIELSSSQRARLTKKGFSVSAIEKRRRNRIANTSKQHKDVRDLAKRDIQSLSRQDLLLIGTALYWGEGNKASRGVAGVTNRDPALIKVMMRFFREVCKVKEEKFRGHVHTFSHLNARASELYWSSVSGIPYKQFYKTYTKKSKASKDQKDNLPYGTFQIYICDTQLLNTIKGWIERVTELGIRA